MCRTATVQCLQAMASFSPPLESSCSLGAPPLTSHFFSAEDIPLHGSVCLCVCHRERERIETIQGEAAVLQSCRDSQEAKAAGLLHILSVKLHMFKPQEKLMPQVKSKGRRKSAGRPSGKKSLSLHRGSFFV